MRPFGDRLRSPAVRRVARATLIVVVAAAAAWAYEWTSFARDMERTTGEIVEMTRTPFSGSTGDPYTLRIRFEAEGEARYFTANRSVFQHLSGDFETGNRVPVAFDPANPAEARLGDFFHVYPVFGTLLAFMGIVLLATVVLIFRA